MQISLCMIVLNEEKHLKRCLSSVKDAVDEIIIVDSGSTDATKAVAQEFTDKVYDFEWCDDFSAARNFSFSHASKDFVMWLDADDIMLKEDVKGLLTLKNQLTNDIDAVMLKYNTGFDENGRVIFSYYRERLAKRSRGFVWVEPIHEYLAVNGSIIRSDIAITHAKRQGVSNTSRNITIYENLLKDGKKLSPRGTYYYARELKDSGNFNLAAAYYKKFLQEDMGWVEDNISACADLYRCLSVLDNDKEALYSLYQSFVYDLPRAEICCLLGYHYKQEKKYDLAVYWFRAALKCAPERVKGFFNPNWHGYIPSIELAYLYHILGNTKRAIAFNNLAGRHNPNDASYQHNKRFFATLQ